MIEERIDKLITITKNTSKIYNQWTTILNDTSINGDSALRQRGARIVWYDHERFGLHSFFVEKNLDTAKQHFYTCAMLDLHLITKYGDGVLEYGLNHLSYALLSDSSELIHRYVGLKPIESDIISGSGFVPTCIIHCLIRDDWKEYERLMPIMKGKVAPKFKMQLDVELFEAIAEKNKEKIEQVLAQFVTPKIHQQRNKNYELVNQFISNPALCYAKLAWIKGLEVDIQSTLVPKHLLPVKPLQAYKTEYSFLLEG